MAAGQCTMRPQAGTLGLRALPSPGFLLGRRGGGGASGSGSQSSRSACISRQRFLPGWPVPRKPEARAALPRLVKPAQQRPRPGCCQRLQPPSRRQQAPRGIYRHKSTAHPPEHPASSQVTDLKHRLAKRGASDAGPLPPGPRAPAPRPPARPSSLPPSGGLPCAASVRPHPGQPGSIGLSRGRWHPRSWPHPGPVGVHSGLGPGALWLASQESRRAAQREGKPRLGPQGLSGPRGWPPRGRARAADPTPCHQRQGAAF